MRRSKVATGAAAQVGKTQEAEGAGALLALVVIRAVGPLEVLMAAVRATAHQASEPRWRDEAASYASWVARRAAIRFPQLGHDLAARSSILSTIGRVDGEAHPTGLEDVGEDLAAVGFEVVVRVGRRDQLLAAPAKV